MTYELRTRFSLPLTAYIGSHFGPNRFFERDGTCKSSVIDLTTRERLKMYKRILLAYDGSVEGRTALREGALLARQCGADVFLLSVLVIPVRCCCPRRASLEHLFIWKTTSRTYLTRASRD